MRPKECLQDGPNPIWESCKINVVVVTDNRENVAFPFLPETAVAGGGNSLWPMHGTQKRVSSVATCVLPPAVEGGAIGLAWVNWNWCFNFAPSVFIITSSLYDPDFSLSWQKLLGSTQDHKGLAHVLTINDSVHAPCTRRWRKGTHMCLSL